MIILLRSVSISVASDKSWEEFAVSDTPLYIHAHTSFSHTSNQSTCCLSALPFYSPYFFLHALILTEKYP